MRPMTSHSSPASMMLLFLQMLLSSLHVWTVTAESELTCSHQQIAALPGDDVILPCGLDPPISASSETVEWTRPDLDPKYIHIHRDGRLMTELQHPSYKNHTELFVDELKNGNVSLKISAVKVSDAGTYKCFLPLMKKEATIKLIVGDCEVIGSHEPVTAAAGDDIVLPCRLEPPLDMTTRTVEWKHNGSIVHFCHSNEDDLTDQDENYRGRTSLFYEELIRGNISLKLINVTEQDEGNYTCFVPELDRRGFITLIVGGGFGTYVIIAMVGAAAAALGALVAVFAVLVCKCRRLRAAEPYRQELIPTVSLETCESTSSALAHPGSVSPHRSTSNTAESELTCSHQPIVALVGQDVTLPCGLKPPISATSQTVEWSRPDLDPKYIHVHRDGRLMVELQHPSYKNRTGLFVDELKNGNVSLKISGVNVSDAGTYRCFLPLMKKQATISLIVDSEEDVSDKVPGPAQPELLIQEPHEDGSWSYCVIS